MFSLYLPSFYTLPLLLLLQDMCKRLSGDISKMKSAKVVLQKSMESSAKQFANWRQEREKVGAGG